MRTLIVLTALVACHEALAHGRGLERRVIVQPESGGGASVLFEVAVPRGSPALLLRNEWDWNHDGSLDERERRTGAVDFMSVALADAVLLTDGAEADCAREVDARGLLVNDEPLIVAALWQCEPAGAWRLILGAKLASAVSLSEASRDAVVVGLGSIRLSPAWREISWWHAPGMLLGAP